MWILIHPNNTYAITIQSENYIRKWDISGEFPVLIMNRHISHKVYNPTCDSKVIGIINTRDKSIDRNNCLLEIYDWETLELLEHNEIEVLKEKLFWFQCVSFSPDGSIIALASFNEGLALIEREEYRLIDYFEGGEWISGLAFDNTSCYMAAAHTFQGGGYISVYERKKNRLNQLHKKLFRPIETGDFADKFAKIMFTSDSNHLVICETSINGLSEDFTGYLMLYETITGCLIWSEKLKSEGEIGIYPEIHFSSDDNYILCGMGYGKIYWYSLLCGKYYKTTNTGLHEPIQAFTVDRIGNRIWIACDDGNLVSYQE